MTKLAIHWRKILSADSIRRSSHTLAVHDSSIILFGGEIQPRKPVPSSLTIIGISASNPSIETTDSSSGPSPRVGAASATVNGHTYVFSGRGGPSMTPLTSEPATIWALSSTANAQTWTPLTPPPSSPHPEPRSYHAMSSDTRDAIFVHAGCPASGRLNDLWAFQPSSTRWISLADAPGPPRGGTSIAFCPSTDKLYRFGGFDGTTEVGGVLDVYDPGRNCWSERFFAADGIEGPKPRSVGSLLSVSVDSQSYLLVLFGEGEPSDKGHEGAGRMFGDVWAWDIAGETWSEVQLEGHEQPDPRGWFAAGSLSDDEVVVQGGLGEDNERFGDLWTGKILMVKEGG